MHSDRGSQFRAHVYVRALRAADLHGSMGRVGAAADNAAMESFFSLLQKNVLNRRHWATRAQLRAAIVHWIVSRVKKLAGFRSWEMSGWSGRPGLGGRATAGSRPGPHGA